MEYENKYASKAVGGTALGIAIGAGALSLMNNNGNLGGLLGGNCRNNGADAAITAAALLSAGNNHNCCTAPAYTRYDAEKDAIIARLETEIKLRDANTYTLNEVGKFRDYMESRLGVIEREICDQRTYNAVNTATIGCIRGQVDTLLALTKTVVPIDSICPTPAVATTTA
jgi:hypothetical protein